jgi:hypothetical protein
MRETPAKAERKLAVRQDKAWLVAARSGANVPSGNDCTRHFQRKNLAQKFGAQFGAVLLTAP